MLVLPQTLTAAEAPDGILMLSGALSREAGPTVVADASGLKHFDSSALAVLLECQRIAQAAGKSFAVRQAPSKLWALARLYGVDVLLQPADDAPPSTAASTAAA